MKYRTLPGTGVSVSNLALGTMGFGTETDEPDAFAILDRFVEAAGNLVDTSNVCGRGASKELIGRWFASRPADVTERVVLATKAVVANPIVRSHAIERTKAIADRCELSQ